MVKMLNSIYCGGWKREGEVEDLEYVLSPLLNVFRTGLNKIVFRKDVTGSAPSLVQKKVI